MFVITLITGIIPLIALELILMGVCEDTVISTRVKNVSAQFSVFSTYLSQNYIDNDEDSETLEEASELIEDIAGMYMSRIQLINRDFNIVSDTYQINRGRLCISQDVNKCFNGTNSAYADKANQCIIMVQAVKDSETDAIKYVVFATSSISDIFSAMSSIKLIGTAIIVIVGILVVFAALYSSGKLTAPFRKINDVIGSIERGHMQDDISLKGCTEVEQISTSFNVMLGRINKLEKSRQEFVSNVSHELKTPLTSMKVLADSLLMNEEVPAEMYREFMGDLSNEIDRENAIITDLLALVKLDNAGMSLNISSRNINEMISSTMKIVGPLARRKNIDVEFESIRSVTADVDEVKLSMAISNLVENAVKYNNIEGWVHVSLDADQTYFYISVRDNGFGIPAEAQEKIFDRFYRVDKARDRATGGTGLGLAITKSIIIAHNGDISVSSEENAGTTFSIKIPLTYGGSGKRADK